MKKRRSDLTGICVSLLMGWALAGFSYGAQEKPNIVLLYIDD